MKKFKRYYEEITNAFMPFEEDPVIIKIDDDNTLNILPEEGDYKFTDVYHNPFNGDVTESSIVLSAANIADLKEGLYELKSDIENNDVREQKSIVITGADGSWEMNANLRDSIDVLVNPLLYGTGRNKQVLGININIEDVDSIVRQLDSLI